MPREQTWELFPSDMYKKANKCKFNEFVREGLRSESVLRQHLSNQTSNFQSIGVRLPSYMHIYKTSVLRHREIPLQRKTERVLYVINSSIELF